MTDPADNFELMFKTPYIRAIELLGKDLTLTIVRIERDVTIVGDGGKETIKPLLHFKGDGKPMVCNVTNGRTIAGMYGEAARGWVGHDITLFATVDRGQKCIRIRPKGYRPPRQQQPPTGDAALAARLLKQIEAAETMDQAMVPPDDAAKLSPAQLADVRGAYRARRDQLDQPPPEPTPDLAGLVIERINAAKDLAELEAAAASATEVAKLEDSGDYERVNERYEDREATLEQQVETEATRS